MGWALFAPVAQASCRADVFFAFALGVGVAILSLCRCCRPRPGAWRHHAFAAMLEGAGCRRCGAVAALR
eukprot:495400-Lingulodinium_polyedra.AAC.1